MALDELMPPLTRDPDDQPRRVGVEIEFAELGLERTSAILVELFGGRAVHENECELRVIDTRLGEFHVEVDSRPLKTIAKKLRRGKALGLLERVTRATLGSIAGTLTPHEITTPPVMFDQLEELDRLVQVLRRAGAEGTEASLLYVFGVHFNPSAPSHDPLILRDYIRAAALLHDQLLETLRVDLSRLVSGYAKPYPTAYQRLVLAPDYAPDLAGLIDDYLAHNDRNRALDMLPLFAHLDRDRVQRQSQDPLVKARPTFHFRLPNSRVSDPDWRITDDWKRWLDVERLAADRPRLEVLAAEARAQLGGIDPAPRRLWRALLNATRSGSLRAASHSSPKS